MGLGIFADADADVNVQLLSDEWRSTLVLIVLTICVTALGITAFLVLRDFQIIVGLLLLLFTINRKALGLDLKQLKTLTHGMSQRKDSKP